MQKIKELQAGISIIVDKMLQTKSPLHHLFAVSINKLVFPPVEN